MSPATSALSEQIAALSQAVKSRLPLQASGAAPRVGLVLGSGLGDYADTLSGAIKIPYGELPGFPVSKVVGHAGNLVYGGGPGGVPVLAMQGRVHYYEGHGLDTVVLPIRTLIACGCDTLILTNAAGGIAAGLQPGELVLLSDHLNLMGASPLRGENDGRLGPRFPDMSAVYDPALRALARRAGQAMGMDLREGIYAGCNGPQYETPAEVRMLRTLGADLVGMSTVPESIAARHMGARVLGISCVTNLAAGLGGPTLSHDEVTETANRVRGAFIQLLDGILKLLANEVRPNV